MMMQLLAQAGGDGVWMSLGAITALGIAIAAVVKAYRSGVQKGTTTGFTLNKPVPTVTVREEERFVGRGEFGDRFDRVDAEHRKLWEQFGTERKILNHEIENIQKRLDSQSTATASLQGTVDEVNKTVGQLLSIALNARKPGSRP